MTQLLRDFISLLYPRNCINCQRILIQQEEFLCIHCVFALPIANFHRKDPNPILSKLCSVPNVANAFAYLTFSRRGIAQKMIHKIKYEGQRDLGYQLGEWFGHEIMEFVDSSKVDMIIPIPLHKSRQKERGYNQSDLIAHGLSVALDIPYYSNLLTRSRYTVTQTQKTKTERWINVAKLFQVVDNQSIKDKHILLVDDVMTTGATIESAIQELVTSGSSKVSIACLASRS